MTKKELEQLYYLKKEIEMWQRELDKIRCKSLIGSPVWDGIGGHSGTSDKVADTAISEAEVTKIIESKKAEITLQRVRILAYIANIDDTIMRQIMYWRHVACVGWDKTAMEIGGGNTADGIRMAHDRYLSQDR